MLKPACPPLRHLFGIPTSKRAPSHMTCTGNLVAKVPIWSSLWLSYAGDLRTAREGHPVTEKEEMRNKHRENHLGLLCKYQIVTQNTENQTKASPAAQL